MMTKKISILSLCFLITCGLYAQKFGYVSTAAILDAMPEVDLADKQLAAFQEGLVKGGQSKVTSFETNYKKYLEEVNQGTLSKLQQQEREAALAKEQESISQYEQQVQLQVMQKREELLRPILQKVDDAVQTVGKDGGYTFIFDSSVAGALLYAQPADNLFEEIKRKLGIQ